MRKKPGKSKRHPNKPSYKNWTWEDPKNRHIARWLVGETSELTDSIRDFLDSKPCEDRSRVVHNWVHCYRGFRKVFKMDPVNANHCRSNLDRWLAWERKDALSVALKWTFAAAFSKATSQDIPDSPSGPYGVGGAEGKLKMSTMFTGNFGGHFRSVLRMLRRKMSKAVPSHTALSKCQFILQMKKGCARTSDRQLDAAVKKTIVALTEKHPEELPERVRLRFEATVKKVVREVFSRRFRIPVCSKDGDRLRIDVCDVADCPFEGMSCPDHSSRSTERYYTKKVRFHARKDPQFPSMRGHFNMKRVDGGAASKVLATWDKCRRLTDAQDRAVIPWKMEGHFNGILCEPESPDRHRRFREAVRDKISKESRWFFAKPHAIAEPLKTRVVTMGPEFSYWLLRDLQKFLWETLSRHPTFGLIGKPVSEEIVARLLGTDLSFLSGDFKDATNNLSSFVSNFIAREICEFIGLDCSFGETFLRSLTGHTFPVLKEDGLYEYAKFVYRTKPASHPDFQACGVRSENAKRKDLIKGIRRWNKHCDCSADYVPLCEEYWEYRAQTNGQLMGSPTSFPVLCLANAVLSLMVLGEDSHETFFQLLEKEKGRSADTPAPLWSDEMELDSLDQRYYDFLKSHSLESLRLLINGDDVVFPCTDDQYAGWLQLGRLVGLESSIGKTYRSKTWLQINSQCFCLDANNSLRIVPYINIGHLSPNDPKGGEPRTWQMLSALERDFLKAAQPGASANSCFNREFLIDWFLNDHKELLLTIPNGVCYWIPKHLGGAGLITYRKLEVSSGDPDPKDPSLPRKRKRKSVTFRQLELAEYLRRDRTIVVSHGGPDRREQKWFQVGSRILNEYREMVPIPPDMLPWEIDREQSSNAPFWGSSKYRWQCVKKMEAEALAKGRVSASRGNFRELFEKSKGTGASPLIGTYLCDPEHYSALKDGAAELLRDRFSTPDNPFSLVYSVNLQPRVEAHAERRQMEDTKYGFLLHLGPSTERRPIAFDVC